MVSQAYVIIDNSSAVWLYDYYLNEYQSNKFSEILPRVFDHISMQFNIIRNFAIENKIFTTNFIVSEFLPERGLFGRYRGVTEGHCNQIKRHFRTQVETKYYDAVLVSTIQKILEEEIILDEYRGEFIRLSLPDLSLFCLTFEFTYNNDRPVRVLTEDTILRDFLNGLNDESAFSQQVTAHKCNDYLNNLP